MTADCSSGGKLPRAFGYAGFLLAASSLERQRMSRPNELAATLAAPFPFLPSRSGYHRFARGREQVPRYPSRPVLFSAVYELRSALRAPRKLIVTGSPELLRKRHELFCA